MVAQEMRPLESSHSRPPFLLPHRQGADILVLSGGAAFRSSAFANRLHLDHIVSLNALPFVTFFRFATRMKVDCPYVGYRVVALCVRRACKISVRTFSRGYISIDHGFNIEAISLAEIGLGS